MIFGGYGDFKANRRPGYAPAPVSCNSMESIRFLEMPPKSVLEAQIEAFISGEVSTYTQSVRGPVLGRRKGFPRDKTGAFTAARST